VAQGKNFYLLIIYNIVYFAEPGEVENLILTPSSHNISVSVRAENEKNEGTDAVTDIATTETVGNYHTQIILLYL
jgi:hypothetical protein